MAQKHDVAVCSWFKHSVSLSKKIPSYEGNGTALGFYRQLRRALTAEHYDIVHAHDPYLGAAFAICRAAKLIPCTSKAILTVHHSLPIKVKQGFLYMPCFRLFDRVVFCSYSSKASFDGRLGVNDNSRFLAICNGADIERIDRAVSLEAATTGCVSTVLWVGRFIKGKHPMVMLDAWRQFRRPGTRLVMVGDGPLLPEIRRAVVDGGLTESVTLLGLISRDKVFGLLKSSDLFISTSAKEGLPLAVLEAIGAGCPVILSDIAPHREISRHCSAVPLVRVGDASGFSEAISTHCEKDTASVAETAEANRQVVVDHFSLRHMNAKYYELYCSLV